MLRKPNNMRIIISMICCWCLAFVAASQPNITRAEYFFNTDPGFGNATSIAFAPSAIISNQSFQTDLSLLPSGLNTLYLRTMDANGKWSVTNRLFFLKAFAPIALSEINKAEYFIDNDPGIGNATDIPIPFSSNNITDLIFPVNLPSLSEGVHFLFVRSRSANGSWSVSNYLSFVRLNTYALLPKITRMEYFVDTDPGFGSAISVPISPANEIANSTFQIDLSNVPAGLHVLHFRSADSLGKWSITNRCIVVKSSPTASAGNLVKAETFIDNDPGFGNAVPISLNASKNIGDFAYPLNITGLSPGKHRMYVRSMDENGKWSVTGRDSFDISTPASVPYINVNSITGKNLCGSKVFSLSFHATGNYDAGNTFSAQLSDATGSFASPIIVGNINANKSSTIECTIPLHIQTGTNYRVRVVSSNPAVVGVTADSIFVLNDQPRFDDTTVYIVCQGETADLTNLYNTSGYAIAWSASNPAAAPAGVHQLFTTNNATLGCKDTANVAIQQDVGIWQGTQSTSWHNASNWSNGHVPTIKTHVIIASGTPNICTVNAQDGEAASVQVKPGATIQFGSGRKVSVVARCNPLPNN